MTTIEYDHYVAAEGTAPALVRTARLRPGHIIAATIGIAVVSIAALVGYIDYKTAPAPATAVPAIHLEVGGDIARTTGTVTYPDGTTAQLQEGEGGYNADLGRSRTPQALSIAVVSGFEPAWCTIVIDGQLAVRKDATGGGEMALCTWTPAAG